MDSPSPSFELLDHTADMGMVVRGTDLPDLFKTAAGSLTRLMVVDSAHRPTDKRRLSVDGEDLEDLMVRWLGEILYLFEGEHTVVADTAVESVSPSHLDAVLDTFPFDPAVHDVHYEIKAVTYHRVRVVELGDHWEARVIFDL